jgi:hypothetical protein
METSSNATLFGTLRLSLPIDGAQRRSTGVPVPVNSENSLKDSIGMTRIPSASFARSPFGPTL